MTKEDQQLLDMPANDPAAAIAVFRSFFEAGMVTPFLIFQLARSQAKPATWIRHAQEVWRSWTPEPFPSLEDQM